MRQLQQKIITQGRSNVLADQEKTLEKELMEKDKQEEMLWKQKSRIRWLKEGEKNTKFFHNTTIQRRMHNNITHIQNEQGAKLEKHEEIEAELLNHFKQVHKEPSIDRSQAIQNITSKIPKLISDQHNQMLLKPIDLQEVESTVKQLKVGKAPGSDGFTSNFFHHFWDLIKNEVWQVVEESRSLRWMFPGINATFLALIPKVEKPCKPNKFRPISLCNIIYKIISKIIATRIKLLLPLIISLEQSGYVEGRQITDGIILTHEIIHSLKTSKKQGMLLKLDLSKDFDSLSWNYMEKILLAFGFNTSWSKSQIFFFHTPSAIQSAILRILKFTSAKLPSTYLGAPLIASSLKHSAWKSLLEKLEARLSSWTHRSLNMASRLVLIKAILQAMPLYLFSILSAPKWVLKELKTIQRAFLWGSKGLHRKWALVKWETACLPKKGGGIRLLDPTHSNAVMGARIRWRWLSGSLTPWTTLWTTKYVGNCPREELVRISEMSNGSIIWNSSKIHRNLIQQHSFWEVKSGDQARFWDESWQQLPKLRDLFPNIAPAEQDLHPPTTVGNLWSITAQQDIRKWHKASQIIANGTEQEQQTLDTELEKRKIQCSEGKDILRWGYEERGTYSTKEAYNLLIKD
eukprot:PITA_20401